MGAERERHDVVRIVEFWMMVHYLRLDGDFDDEGDCVAEGSEVEPSLYVSAFKYETGDCRARFESPDRSEC